MRPESPICSLSESYSHLKKASGIHSSPWHSISLNIGKYEVDLDSTASGTFNTLGITDGITCAGLVISSGTTSYTVNSSGVSLTGPNILTVAGNMTTGSLTCTGNAIIKTLLLDQFSH